MHDNAYILDTETTGTDEPQAIEVAHVRLSDSAEFCQRYKPSKAISIGAMATHNILDEDLADCPPAGSYKLPDDCEYLIGHNVGFDVQAIGGAPDTVKLIDTLLLSRVVFNDADSHTQLACLYRIDRKVAQQLAHGAHGALADVRMNAIVFNHICSVIGTNDLALLSNMSEMAKIPEKITFGKHNGALFKDIPPDYKRWYMGQADTDPYVVAAMRGAEPLTLEKAQGMAAEGRQKPAPGQLSLV